MEGMKLPGWNLLSLGTGGWRGEGTESDHPGQARSGPKAGRVPRVEIGLGSGIRPAGRQMASISTCY